MRLSYPFKVWLTTVLAAPFILMAWFWFSSSAPDQSFIKTLPLVLIMALFGLGISLPSLWLYLLLYRELKHASLGNVARKAILALVAASLIWITFCLFDPDFFIGASLYVLSWPATYSIVLVAATFLFTEDKALTAGKGHRISR